MTDAPTDEHAIPDEAILLRRFPHTHMKSVPDDGFRLTSQAFLPASQDGDAISVYVENMLGQAGLDMHALLAGHAAFGIAAIAAGDARSLGLAVRWAPEREDGIRGACHAEVSGALTERVRRHLREAATIRVWPADP